MNNYVYSWIQRALPPPPHSFPGGKDPRVGLLNPYERCVARSGRDSIDHPRGGHDDVAKAVAGAAAMLARRSMLDDEPDYEGMFVDGLGPRCFVDHRANLI